MSTRSRIGVVCAAGLIAIAGISGTGAPWVPQGTGGATRLQGNPNSQLPMKHTNAGLPAGTTLLKGPPKDSATS